MKNLLFGFGWMRLLLELFKGWKCLGWEEGEGDDDGEMVVIEKDGDGR